MATEHQPGPDVTVVAMGGSTRPGSSTEMAVRLAGQAAEDSGARVVYITGRDLILPIYDTETEHRSPGAKVLVEVLREAHGVIIASPGYHGGMSGMIKNALDYLEDLREDTRPYLHDRAVGCIAVADGWQATVSTLQQIRQVAHALRGWPTPLGAVINTQVTKFAPDGSLEDSASIEQLTTVGEQVLGFARMRTFNEL